MFYETFVFFFFFFCAPPSNKHSSSEECLTPSIPTNNKTRCFCGKSEDDYNEHGPAICNMKCSGDNDLICGGFGAMNVFSV